MNIALIGYGRMGHEIEQMAVKRGHSVKLKIDINNKQDFISDNFTTIDAVIEFSSPGSAFGNIKKCLEMKKPVVSGTTGWLSNYDNAAELCRQNNTSFIHSSNFSVGVNILFKLNADLARLMKTHKEYTPSIEEIHHTKKLDSPSGTAITLSEGIRKSHEDIHGWCIPDNKDEKHIPIKSIREGEVPGTHTVTWDSEIDIVSIKHEAKGRKGFALGAVLAAEFIYNRKGVFTMNDVLGF
jgi:4-hydroxy-tetrahydrodipicolinate reductase